MGSENNLTSSLLKARTDLMDQIAELRKDVESLDRLLARHGSKTGTEITRVTALEAVNGNGLATSNSPYYKATYTEATTWKQKIYFIINENPGSNVNDVTKKLTEYEKDMTEEQAKKNAFTYLSNLYTEGQIKADTKSSPYRYSV